ncbi:MAG TPA: SDR family NAD(P)-dependent oxidoreductase, partial [Bryobacteraceae bacterium]|nr:SDR family NAD(P)-dependent oxidoreductase [Bryobacteraceae bacterium]
LYLIGSNRLDEYPRDIFTGTNEEFAKRRAVYIREQKASHPEKTLAVVNREFERMIFARTAQQNIAEMERYCGAGRVHYIACDVLDRGALERAMAGVLQAEKRVDLVIHSAGLNRSSSIPVKSLADFRAVRDLKVRGYQNLKHALRSAQPRIWCNFGSFIGLTGQMGETDYSAGNDFLNSAAGYAARRQGVEEFTIGWTLWSTVGLGSHPVFQTFLEKSGLYTKMTTEEGIHHFIREVNYPRHAPSIVYMGPAEKKALSDYLPDYFNVPETRAAEPGKRGSFYLDRVLERGSDEMLFERVFDLERDAYLEHHVVNGYATLPGTFVTEIAAEAASQLVPGWKVIALEDVVFHHFLRVYDKSRPSVKKIHAKIVERSEEQTVVQVRVLTDVLGPKGTVLVKDKLHFEIKAVLRKEYPQAPQWEPWNRFGEVAIPDPYHFASAPVALTEMFVSTRNTRLHALGKRADYAVRLEQNDPVFSNFLLPTILLDGLARIAVLNYVQGEYLPLAAPASIRRIDLYEDGNDCFLSHHYQDIELYSTPREFTFEGRNASNRFVAARPDGKILLQMKDVRGIVMGYVHRTTGEYVAPNALEALEQAPESVEVLEGAGR